VPAAPPPKEEKPPAPPPAAEAPPAPPAGGGSGTLSADARDAVKRATVYIRVAMQQGTASGSGFFGAPDAPSLVLTNAHVVGMLSPDSPRPSKVEVVVNSGESGEKTFVAKILGVDRISDLAVLDVGSKPGLPRPLTVKSATAVRELDNVYVFGFPLGETLGKEITIRPSSVSSLRKRNGVLHHIQVNGGMDEGNSGGPVVDSSGHVIGVAVSGYKGRLINFAIPGDRVHAILAGRLAGMKIGDAFKTSGSIGVPVTIEMIDPRGRVKEVALEVWTGDEPPAAARTRPASNAQPAAQPGDTPHMRYPLANAEGVAGGDVTLPLLPPGKVYWVQPSWTFHDGSRRWGLAEVHKLKSAPMERTAVALQFRSPGAAARRVMMSSTNRLLVGASDDTEVYALTTEVVFSERVALTGTNMTFTLGYESAKKTQVLGGKTVNADPPGAIRRAFPLMKALFTIDGSGGLVQNRLGTINTLQLRKLGLLDRKVVEGFHEPIKEWMAPLMLPVPNKTLEPRETWRLRRTLGWHPPTGTSTVAVPLDLVCSYLGVRGAAGEQEAVIGLQGTTSDRRVTGKVRGTMTVSVAGGAIKNVEMDVEMDVPDVVFQAGGRSEKLKVRSVQALRLSRGL
jgi:S1-C subfamily serine protease